LHRHHAAPPLFPSTTLFRSGYYWLALAALVAVALLYRRLTTFRLGRAFHAVRDNEPLAGAAGIDPLRYRMLAFTIGAALAGGVRSEEHTSELQSRGHPVCRL